ncbi:MAG: zinc-ribbon domain-containing protein [Clostridia bacterium]|nr:zinc-ribbon domain-containing protein [Clostridia bacterium]
MLCPVCGKELSDDARFCDKCGIIIAREDAADEIISLEELKNEDSAVDTVENTGEIFAAELSDIPEDDTIPASADMNIDEENEHGVHSVNEDHSSEISVRKDDPSAGFETPSAPRKLINPMFTNSLKILRGFFSRYTFRIVSASTKSRSLEGTLFAAACILFFALALPINLRQYDALAEMTSLKFNFLGVFGMSLLSGIFTYAALVGAVWGLLNFVIRKKTDFIPVLNMVGVASIPMTCAFILNLLLGFWTPLAIISVGTAAMISFMLLYHGVKTFAGISDDSVFFPFVLAMAAVFAAALLFLYLTYIASVSVIILTIDILPA